MSEEIANEQETAVLQPEEVQVEATAAAEETNATETETTEAILENPFDFTVEPEPDDEVIEEVVDGGEYAPDFGSYFGGSAEVRGMITGHAKAAGIPAEAAGKFVAAVCKSLREDQLRVLGEGQRGLEEEWGREYGVKLRGCKEVLHGLLKGGVIKSGDVEGLMTPAVFRVVSALRERLGEKGAEGTRAAAGMDARAEYERIMGDTSGEQFRILMNPGHPKYRETADYVNSLAGTRLW